LDGKFAAKKKDEQELRDVCKVVFYGGSCAGDPELEPLFAKWHYFIELFLLCKNCENGDYNFTPTSNSPHEQPYKTMRVLSIIQNLWIEKIEHDSKRQKNGG